MVALNRAVTHACGPGGAVLVGDDLDFDLSRVLKQFLDEDGGIAESFECFRARPFKSHGELGRVVGHANAAASASGSRLNKEGIAQAAGMVLCLG